MEELSPSIVTSRFDNRKGARSWGDLTQREHEQISLMLLSLKEFSYGYDRANEVAKHVSPGAAMLRFYMTSLYHYCANYFLVGGANKLRNVLEQLSSHDLLQPIDSLLSTRLGDTSFGEVIRTWRDKVLTDQSFTFAPLETRIMHKFNYLEPENSKILTAMIQDLFVETKRLYVALALRYPEAISA